jgi:hypothetical protein
MAKRAELVNKWSWKNLAVDSGEGFYNLRTEDTGDVPVRLFLTPALLDAGAALNSKSEIRALASSSTPRVRAGGLDGVTRYLRDPPARPDAIRSNEPDLC